ncbi:recombinase RecT [Flavobacterium anhuiense]|uniref:recombinase RecT n=1 Tax=Flavobacterium anhuiense TaxID=459526 RepID=UPI0020265F8A|nr:recombinase RecT [Flavobacterium anhuiense]URM37188.1 recombinase RecT [Flavobacterium anhuiense]
MSTTNTPAETPQTNVANVQISQSERFTNAVIKEFSSNNGAVTLTPFQKKLCQNYFIKVDQTLKDNERKRLSKAENYRESLAFTWDNVNMSKLAIDVIAYSSVELDPTQPNHISIVPYKNTANNKYDMGFLIGYRGMEIKAKKYGLDVPSDVVCKLVYSSDKFKQFPKDKNNPVESYSFEITNDFDRGDVVGDSGTMNIKTIPKKINFLFFRRKILRRENQNMLLPNFGAELKISGNSILLKERMSK